MQKAGGIIGLIAGIFGVLAAGITLLVGGFGAVAKTDTFQTVVGLGWGQWRVKGIAPTCHVWRRNAGS